MKQNDIPKIWQCLKVLRDNGNTVEARYILEFHRGLYHHFSQRCGDLKRLYGYNIPKAVHIGPEEWDFRWTLLNPDYTHPKELEVFPPVPVYFEGGQAIMDLGMR